MPIDLVIDDREGAGSTTSKSPEQNPDPSDLATDPVSLASPTGHFSIVYI